MRKLTILVLVCLSLTMLVPADAQDTVTLQFWSRLGDNQQVSDMVAEWNQAHPEIQVEYQGIPSSDYRTKLLASVAGGTAPDIVGMDVAIMPQYSGLGALLALDDRIPEDMRSDFASGLWFSNTFNDQTFGVPWWSDPSALFYNETLFEQAGIQQPPETWDDLKADAAAITALTTDPSDPIYGVVMNVIQPGVMFTWLPYLWGNGGDLLDANNCAAFNTEAGAQAMQVWVDIVQNGDMPRSAVYGESADPLNSLFYSNHLGMMTGSAALYDQALKVNPDLKINTVVMPRSADGQHSSYLGGDNLVIMNGSKYADQAWQFIQFMVDPTRMSEMAAANHGVFIAGMMSRTSAYSEDHFTQYPYQRAFADAQAVGRAPNTTYISEIRMPIWQDFQAALDGTMSVQDALNDSETQVNDITGCTS